MDEHAKTAGDALSLVVVGATLLKWLPAIAALFTIVWTAIRIYESRTVQNLINGKEERDPYDDPL